MLESKCESGWLMCVCVCDCVFWEQNQRLTRPSGRHENRGKDTHCLLEDGLCTSSRSSSSRSRLTQVRPNVLTAKRSKNRAASTGTRQ